MCASLNRREFLKRAGLLGAAAARLADPARQALAGPAPPAVGTIKLGRTEVSRLLLDEQPFLGHGHRRYLVCKAMFQYYTDERVLAALAEGGELGVSAAVVAHGGRVQGLHKQHVEGGGRVKHLLVEIIAKDVGIESVLGGCGRPGVVGAFVTPGRTDGKIRGAGWDRLKRFLELIREQNVLVGAATAGTDTLELYEKYAGKGMLPVDFYVQTACPSDEYHPRDRLKALKAIQGVSRPVIVRRVMPSDADDFRAVFAEVFAHLAPKDALCVSVFPKDRPDQIKQYCALAARLSATRPAKLCATKVAPS